MRFRSPSCIALLAFAACSGGGGKSGGAAPARSGNGAASLDGDKWSLWQGGTKLRGANIHQRRSYAEADGADIAAIAPVIPPFVQSDFDALAQAGANCVQISHPGLFTEQAPYVVDPVVQENLDALIAMAAQAKLKVVISFRTGPGRNEFTFLDEEDPGWLGRSLNDDSVWSDAAAQDGWVSMWSYTAQRYKDDPTVIAYDLMVEPNSNVLVDDFDPADFQARFAGTLLDWNQLHPRISAAIRAVDADTPIVTGGMNFSSIAWLPFLQPTGDAKTVYAVHFYEPFVYTHQDDPLDLAYPGTFDADGDGVAERVDAQWLEEALGNVDAFERDHAVPVTINEFGVKRWEPGAADYLRDLLDSMERRGLDHFLWMWGPSDARFAPFVSEFDVRFGPDPGNLTDVDRSDLLDVLTSNWARNS